MIDLLQTPSRAKLPTLSARAWHQTVENLATHGLGGYVYRQHRDHLPADVRDELKKQWNSQWLNFGAFANELAWFAEICAQRKLPVTVLKGMALVGDIYADPGTRSMGDIDLWVRPENWTEVIEIFLAHGFRDISKTRWEANSFKCLLRKSDPSTLEVDVELHQRLFFNETNLIDWRTVEMPTPGLKKLATEDLLVHLMGHLAYQHTFLKLVWLFDIDLLIRKYEKLDWTRVISLVSQLKQRRSASAVLFACEKHFGTPIPAFVHRELRSFSARAWGTLLNQKFLSSPETHFFRYYTLKHLVKDSWTEALKYNWLWLKRRAWK